MLERAANRVTTTLLLRRRNLGISGFKGPRFRLRRQLASHLLSIRHVLQFILFAVTICVDRFSSCFSISNFGHLMCAQKPFAPHLVSSALGAR